MSHYVVLNAEAKMNASHVEKGWDNVFGMGMSSAVTYSTQTQKYRFWKNREDLCEYLTNRVVVSFNGLMFESLLLLGNDRILENNGKVTNRIETHDNHYHWTNIDIYVELWRHIFDMDRTDYPAIIKKIQEQKFPRGIFDLNTISINTIKLDKVGEGINAPSLYQRKMLLRLFEYNLQNVRIIKELYSFIREKRYLVTGSYDVVSF